MRRVWESFFHESFIRGRVRPLLSYRIPSSDFIPTGAYDRYETSNVCPSPQSEPKESQDGPPISNCPSIKVQRHLHLLRCLGRICSRSRRISLAVANSALENQSEMSQFEARLINNKEKNKMENAAKKSDKIKLIIRSAVKWR
jgi:hypothetical protein